MTPTSTTVPSSSRMTASEIRTRYIEFFTTLAGLEHTFVPSSPVVPVNDPTLLFTNAGMNQYKPLFLGQTKQGDPLHGLSRAVNSQKCIRAGGKHNDLDDVGKDTYHHTFFEMLGNWSFGDYFKVEAIQSAWEFLTKACNIAPDRLYATYFGGDESRGLPADDEARELWCKILPKERVLPGSYKDNFWEMGDTGPCGPCSELHYDRRDDDARAAKDGVTLVNTDNNDVIEIWNLVFIQFDRQSADKLVPLPAKHVDTGMGLERLVSVLQGVKSNYDTDVFSPYFAKTQEITSARKYSGKFGSSDEGSVDTAYRVIADHIRTLTFAITDGATPSNEGRGYVLRRVLRRAVRFGRQKLNAKTGFLSELVPVVVETMSDAFPELKKDPQRVIHIVREEEESFGRTLDKGIKHFDSIVGSNTTKVAGDDAFMLYDTYGFPLDLTQQMAEERGMTVDIDGFEKCMEEAREKSRAGAKTGEKTISLPADAIALLNKQNIATTNDAAKYELDTLSAHIVAIRHNDEFTQSVDAENLGDAPIGVVLDRTCFYAESGGQVADAGTITGDAIMRVTDVKSFGGYVLHIGELTNGTIKVGATVNASIDTPSRRKIESNHTATHLLNLGLRSVLGDHVDQKGSLVDAERLRFDFSNNGPVEPDQIARIESIVRDQIGKNLPVNAHVAALGKAQKINTLRAVFGEKYPDPVRVISIGPKVDDLIANPDNPEWMERSVEFCGGTHVKTTGDIATFALLSETGIAKGIRRVEAFTGEAAHTAKAAADALLARIDAATSESDDQLQSIVSELNTSIDAAIISMTDRESLRAALAPLQERAKSAAKAAAAGKAKVASERARALAESLADDGILVETLDVDGDRGAMQAALKTIEQMKPNAAIMLLSASDTSIAIIAAVSKDHNARGLKAGDWVREVASVVGGKGGGKPDHAQGGGADVAKLDEAIMRANEFAASLK
ncbi:MAG: alanine--tRNA ligase [Phycisphaeraceae bacterium]|nr:alanine--tRNA ligase [Phycisphaerales bacterium]MCB9860367.1 alanine--tRNA ligase [Phycisphaeraceae bacterium]